MKRISLAVLLCFTLIACKKKEPAQEEQKPESYGEAFDASKAQNISKLSELMENSDSISMTLTATIQKTCAVKGCWMQLVTADENPLRVTFKDYGFFVPKTGAEGKVATIQGYCVKQETSVDELRHYAQDAGESDEVIASITAPKMEYNFVASGVIIQD